jgi:hypothetical protein
MNILRRVLFIPVFFIAIAVGLVGTPVVLLASIGSWVITGRDPVHSWIINWIAIVGIVPDWVLPKS